MGRLFGTDGARGIANTEISCELAMKTGRATAMVLSEYENKSNLKILIGTDTRKSADMLVSAMAAGFCSVGCDVFTLGVVPTPAVAFLTKKYSFDAGVMISASHNPYHDNGIKLFNQNGCKMELKYFILTAISCQMKRKKKQRQLFLMILCRLRLK